jgi:tRNA threonylcarbamoyl adenosine modification protein (Sua5/YciO/YrdC/YwlC family)
MILSIHPENPQDRAIIKAVEILRNGGVIVYPTDTVYGLGCDLHNKNAIERIYQIKRHEPIKPFSFLCSDLKHISEYAKVSNHAFRFMKHLIPGPYTFVLPATRLKTIPKSVVSRRKTVGIRVPDNKVCHAIIAALGNPIISTSVTDERGDILSDPAYIKAHLGYQIDLILDAGILPTIPSTVFELTGDMPVILRKGAGDFSFIQQFL